MAQVEWSYASRDLERDWGSVPLSHSRPWDEVMDDVRFGWEQAMNPEFRGAEWSDVETELQRRWEENYPHADYEDWRDVSEAVRLGFNRAKEMVS